jgi:hypothetical protein
VDWMLILKSVLNIGCEGVDWIAQGIFQWLAVVNTIMNL